MPLPRVHRAEKGQQMPSYVTLRWLVSLAPIHCANAAVQFAGLDPLRVQSKSENSQNFRAERKLKTEKSQNLKTGSSIKKKKKKREKLFDFLITHTHTQYVCY
jgi:hypothetical protein